MITQKTAIDCNRLQLTITITLCLNACTKLISLCDETLI